MDTAALDYFRSMMDARVGQAEQIYQVHPELRGTAAALLRLERRMHHLMDGWEMAPNLFYLHRHMRTGRLTAEHSSVFTSMLHHHCRRGYPPATALAMVAMVVERSRACHHARVTGVADPDLPPLPSEATSVLDNLAGALTPDGDMIGCDVGYRLDGIGFATIAYMAIANSGAMDAARAGHLHDHPNRVEMRQVCYMARDGWSFEVSRVHTDGTIEMPRYCIPTNPDDTDVFGTVPQAVSRLCNALVSNPVPIRPLG